MYYFFFSFRLHLFAMMSFRFCDHSQTTQPHSHRLMMQTTSIGWAMRWCKHYSVSKFALIRRSAAVFRCSTAADESIQQHQYQFIIFRRQRTFVTLFTFFIEMVNIIALNWIQWTTHTHTRPNAGLLRRIRSMLLFSNQFIPIPWHTIHKTLSAFLIRPILRKSIYSKWDWVIFDHSCIHHTDGEKCLALRKLSPSSYIYFHPTFNWNGMHTMSN